MNPDLGSSLIWVHIVCYIGCHCFCVEMVKLHIVLIFFSYSGPLGILVLTEIKLVLGCVRIVALSTSSLMNRLNKTESAVFSIL